MAIEWYRLTKMGIWFKKMFHKISLPVSILALALFSTYLFFWNLDAPSIRNDDEAFHSQIVQRIIHTGQWYPPPGRDITRGGDGVYLNKPPLKMWLSASIISIFGGSNFQLRFIDALSGLIATVLVFVTGAKLTKTRWGGLISSLCLLASPGLFFHHCFRHAVQDGFLVLLSTLAIVTYYFGAIARPNKCASSKKCDKASYIAERSEAKQPQGSFIGESERQKTFEEKRELEMQLKAGSEFSRTSCNRSPDSGKLQWTSLVSGILVGCAILVKHIAGVLPLIVILAIAFERLFSVGRNYRRVIIRNFSTCALVALFMGALFYLPIFYLHPATIIAAINREVIERAVSGLHNRDNKWFYLHQLFLTRSGVPREILAVIPIALCWMFASGQVKRDGERHFAKIFFLLSWSTIPIIVYSLGASRLPWYIFPAYPGIALLSGYCLTWLASNLGKYKWLLFIYVLIFLGRPIIKISREISDRPNRIELDYFASAHKALPVLICKGVKITPAERYYLESIDPAPRFIKDCRNVKFKEGEALLVVKGSNKCPDGIRLQNGCAIRAKFPSKEPVI